MPGNLLKNETFFATELNEGILLFKVDNLF
jgi:hypothetical protein